MGAQMEILKTSVIPRILSRICPPSAGTRLRGEAHTAAKDKIEAWALDTSQIILQKKLVKYAATTKAPQTETEVVSKESLKEMSSDAISGQVEAHAPRIMNYWQLYG